MLEFWWWSCAILLPIGALASWLLLLRHSSRSTSKIYLAASASLPPLATTYSLLSWYIGIVSYALPGIEERQESLFFNMVTGTFWRKPLDWVFDKLNIFGPDVPWTQGRGSSSYFGGCFPNAESFKYMVISIINETSVVWLVTVFGVFLVAKWQLRKRHAGI